VPRQSPRKNLKPPPSAVRRQASRAASSRAPRQSCQSPSCPSRLQPGTPAVLSGAKLPEPPPAGHPGSLNRSQPARAASSRAPRQSCQAPTCPSRLTLGTPAVSSGANLPEPPPAGHPGSLIRSQPARAASSRAPRQSCQAPTCPSRLQPGTPAVLSGTKLPELPPAGHPGSPVRRQPARAVSSRAPRQSCQAPTCPSRLQPGTPAVLSGTNLPEPHHARHPGSLIRHQPARAASSRVPRQSCQPPTSPNCCQPVIAGPLASHPRASRNRQSHQSHSSLKGASLPEGERPAEPVP
jgi:hypothetical protein